MTCTAALSWSDTRIAGDTRITHLDFIVLCNIARGMKTRAEIAEAAGCGQSSVPRAVRKLVSVGALERVQTPGKANSYRVKAKPDTRIVGDTRITASRTASDTRVTAGTPKSSPRIEHAYARAETPNKTTLLTEDYPERPESVISSGPPMTPAQHHLNGSAKGMKAHELSSKLIEIIDSPWLNPRSEALARSCGVIRQWIDQGADFDSDVVPTVAEVCTRAGKSISTWKYFTGAITDCVTTRIALQEMQDHKTRQRPHDQSASASEPAIRRDKVSAATAARERDRQRLEAEARDRAINLGRVESVRID